MNQPVLITTYSLLAEYRMDYPAVLLRLKPAILKAKAQTEMTGEVVHEVVELTYNNKHYCCSIYQSSFHTQCIVYMLVPRKNYFEAFAYNNEAHKHYLYHDHFFQRYAERLNIKHKSHTAILKHYLTHNPLILFSQYVKRKGQNQTILAVVRTGVLHGYISLPYRTIINFRTLITHRTLTKKQSVYTSRLRRVLRSMEQCK